MAALLQVTYHVINAGHRKHFTFPMQRLLKLRCSKSLFFTVTVAGARLVPGHWAVRAKLLGSCLQRSNELQTALGGG
jgi:hypothetical protein